MFVSCVFVILSFVFASAAAADQSPTDRVQREIVCLGSELYVIDKLAFNEAFSWQGTELSQVYESARKGETNVLAVIQALLRDDDLTVRGYALAFQSNRAELTIRSRVRFSDGNTARIRWVATLAGIRIDFDGRIVGQRGTEIELIADGGGYFAWFPDFGLVKGDDAKNAREFKKRMEQLSRLLLSTQEEFSCVVLSSGTTNILFDWKQVAKSSGVPSDRVLRSMIRAHPMTFNDYVGLMTNLRIGKPGYYDIRPADARKRDVGLEEKATKGSGPRFRIVPNND